LKMGISFWLITGSMICLILFVFAYSIWNITVGRKRNLPEEIKLVSSESRAYLSEQSSHKQISKELKRNILQKRYLQLLERIGFIFLIFLGVGLFTKQKPIILLITSCIFAGMYAIGILYYLFITSGGIYEVNAVCMDITTNGMGGDGDIQYDFVFYDRHTDSLEGTILVSRRKDMKEILEIGMRTHLLLIVHKGKWTIFDWKE